MSRFMDKALSTLKYDFVAIIVNMALLSPLLATSLEAAFRPRFTNERRESKRVIDFSRVTRKKSVRDQFDTQMSPPSRSLLFLKLKPSSLDGLLLAVIFPRSPQHCKRRGQLGRPCLLPRKSPEGQVGTAFGLGGAASRLGYKYRNQTDSAEGSRNEQCFQRATDILYQNLEHVHARACIKHWERGVAICGPQAKYCPQPASAAPAG